MPNDTHKMLAAAFAVAGRLKSDAEKRDWQTKLRSRRYTAQELEYITSALTRKVRTQQEEV